MRAWQSAYRGIVADSYLDKLPEDLPSRIEQWRMRITQPQEMGSRTLVAESDHQVTGWVTYGPSRDEDAGGEATGEIWGIYVDPERWREQSGTALLSAATQKLTEAGYTQATLWVLEDNGRARRFYERFGWRSDGASEWFERDGHQSIEIRYRRPLP